MKRPNITPGPWRTIVPPSSSFIHREVQNELDEVVAEMPHIGQHGVGVAEAVANAKAIAALPDLLAALEDFVGNCQNGNPMLFMQTAGENFKQAKAALIKAGYTFP